jgi:hypothetical protein
VGIGTSEPSIEEQTHFRGAANVEVTNSLPADFRKNLKRQKNYVTELLNVHDVSDVRQTEIHSAEPLAPGPSCLEVGS